MEEKSLVMLIMVALFQDIHCLDPSSIAEKQPAEADLLSSVCEMLDNAQAGAKYCPPPYTHILGECFYVHQYIPLLTWQEAQDFCKQAGGILAEPRHFGAIIAHLFNTGRSESIFRELLSRVWLGGHRVVNGTTFEWLSGQPINDPVDEGEDPVFFESDGDCIMMLMYKEGPFKLRANACNTKTHYACQLL